MEKLEKGRNLMPSDYEEICIAGGNHAWFGNYGEQAGDGTASISREEQQEQTVMAVLEMVQGEQKMISVFYRLAYSAWYPDLIPVGFEQKGYAVSGPFIL